jgi:hypothetical protein
MHLELNEQERELLTELLEHAHKDKLHELYRTDALGYKQMLREKLAVIENICSKVVIHVTVG